MNKFIERLNELLSERGLNYLDLAKETHLGESTVYSWTSGYNMPKIDKMIILSNYFKCSIEYLLGRTDFWEEVTPKACPPFNESLITILTSRGLKKTYLRNQKIISRGLAESIFDKNSSPCIENVIKIADHLKISVDELVGRV